MEKVRVEYDLPSGDIVVLRVSDFSLVASDYSPNLVVDEITWELDLKESAPDFLERYSVEQVLLLAEKDSPLFYKICPKVLDAFQRAMFNDEE